MKRLAARLNSVRRFCLALLAAVLATVLATSAASAQDAKGSPAHIKAVTTAVDDAAIRNNAATTKDWLNYGLDYAETRFSKLNQITTENVKNLGLMWTFNLESIRGVEATPIVVDGIMYVSASWSVVHAVDTRTGKKIWTYDPGVDREAGYKGCCDVVNRGVALYKGKVYVGAYDGKLHAIDAVTGQKVWEKDTVIDRNKPYTITGAPRIANGKVLIGNGGAEYGVRGYVTAYNAETGEQAWRWFTVPGDPSKPFEDASMEAAAKTWDPAGKWWINGGGGTAWDSIVFDPELNLVYIGTGNGSPWNHRKRSPAGGDNLYLSSIVALNADTGKYVWHYQETPGDNWDYTATQPLILADLTIDGEPAQGDHARAEERLLLRRRPHQRQVHLGEELRQRELGDRLRRQRPADRGCRCARRATRRSTACRGRTGRTTGTRCRSVRRPGLVYIPAQNVPLTLMEDPAWKHDENKPGQFQGGTGWNTAFAINAVPPTSQSRSASWSRGIRSSRQRPGVSSMSRHGTAARWRRPATSCSRDWPTDASSRSTPRPARSCGSRRPAPASSRGPRPISSTACSMCRSQSAGAACSVSPSASTTRKDRARSSPSPSAARRRCRNLPRCNSPA